MIIENPDAFKNWLSSILEPLCDADPAALAKYVYALVKKDRPIEDLRDSMLDQLDVFLQHETITFVDMLFKSLETHEYLKAELKAPTPPAEPPAQATEEAHEVHEHASNGVLAADARAGGEVAMPPRSPPAPAAPRHRVVVVSRGAGAPPAPLKHGAPAAPRAPPHAEQTLVRAALPLTELLDEPLDQQPPRRRDRRPEAGRGEKDDRRRRRSRSWERGRRGPRRHAAWRDNASPHPPGTEARRYDKRRPGSRSPSPSGRGRFRNRSPPNANALDRPASRSRSRSPMAVRERERERDRERLPRDLERDRMSRDRDHRERVSRSRDRDRERDRSRDRSRGSAGTPTQDSNHGDPPPSVVPGGAAAATAPATMAGMFHKRRCRDFDEKGYCMRGDLCTWDHGTDPVVLEDASLSRVLTMQPQIPEYNPLTPDIWSGGALPPGYPGYPTHPHAHQPPRELIPIPRVRDMPPPMGAAMPPAGPPPGPLPPRPHLPPKKNFDYNRLGPIRPPMGANATNCSLEVKKVPWGMNDITHLNNHFSKFGKIVNIQVCFEGDPEAALITFSNHTEANVAYKSTEAVLNNRFIKVFWHNPEQNKQDNPQAGGAGGAPAGTAATPAATAVPPGVHPGSQNKVLINKANMRATAAVTRSNAAAAEKAKEAIAKKEAAVGASVAAAAAVPHKLDKANRPSEHRARAQNLLETQLQQQSLLIERLESGNVTEDQKKVLMEAVKSSQEGIEKLQKELRAYSTMMQTVQANSKKPRTKEEAQKELLDAELDLFTKQQEGLDVTDLLKKVADLRRQMAVQFPSHPPARKTYSRGGGRFSSTAWYSRSHAASAGAGASGAAAAAAAGAPAKVFVNQSVDHRPRAVLVSGFEADEMDAVVEHFAQFGEVVGKEANAAVPELVLQFKVRAQAELAAQRGKHYNDRTLSITWVTNSKPITPVTPAGAPAQAAHAASTPADASLATAAASPDDARAATGTGDDGDGAGGGVIDEKVAPAQRNGADDDADNHHDRAGSVRSEDMELGAELSEDALLRFDEEEEEEAEDRSWRR